MASASTAEQELEEAIDSHGGSDSPFQPMEQFEVRPLGEIHILGLDLSFSNASLWMVIVAVFSVTFLMFAMRGGNLVPTRLQVVAEMLYEIVANMVRDNVGSEGRRYFPFIFTLFIFILFCNLLALIPGSFAVTAQIIVTFFMAIVIFITVTAIGFMRHGLHFFRFFFPEGAPAWTAVILIPIEVVSYLSRPISLSVRIFANMTVGHVLYKILAGFTILMGVAGILPLIALVGITALEFLVAVLQAYVFTILTCVYLHDAIHMH